jgi:hypothetical protein
MLVEMGLILTHFWAETGAYFLPIKVSKTHAQLCSAILNKICIWPTLWQ